MTDDQFLQAQALFNAGNYRRCREVALQQLAQHPDDVSLLKLAGKASLELNMDDAATYLQRVVNQRPDEVEAWHDLGDALVDQGRLAEAMAALREAARLRPDDAGVLVDLGHIAYVLGDAEEAISSLSRAARLEPGNLSTLRSLVDMYRRSGRLQEALDVAKQITDLQPEDVLGTMDVADLNLALGNYDAAVRTYHRLREIDTQQDPNIDHEVYAYHGMIQVEMQRERWRRVLDLAVDATRVDRYGLTTNVLAYAVAQVFGASDRPVPTRSEVDTALAAELAEHRRLHTEALSL
ncbi:MAG: tetratricopeptide repeat protein [Chloroflexi bacterium]|nr:tetratricopeptide repeat protein [Chloroflexota bacterium]